MAIFVAPFISKFFIEIKLPLKELGSRAASQAQGGQTRVRELDGPAAQLWVFRVLAGGHRWRE
jgi:hypothetical protein